MSDAVVALVEELPADERSAFERALPSGWSASSDPTSLPEAEVVVVRDGVLDAATLERAPRLRRVVEIDVGDGSVDVAACEARGVARELVTSPSLNSVAEHAVMLLLMLLKHVVDASERLRDGVIVGDVKPAVTTQESYAYNWVGLERFDALYGKTVGLVGLGRIGEHAATLLRAFGCDVVYTKRTRLPEQQEKESGIRYLPFEELLAASDCVSLHLRFVPETERMMGAREFSLMRPGSLFVNTARGRLVDEAALVDALASGHLGGAALDVYWYEPLPPDNPLLYASNLILTPHTAGIPSAESRVLELQEAARRASV
jgi:lactate dehydrogenase-like 2-hydroxyacid dehydrogenase